MADNKTSEGIVSEETPMDASQEQQHETVEEMLARHR